MIHSQTSKSLQINRTKSSRIPVIEYCLWPSIHILTLFSSLTNRSASCQPLFRLLGTCFAISEYQQHFQLTVLQYHSIYLTSDSTNISSSSLTCQRDYPKKSQPMRKTKIEDLRRMSKESNIAFFLNDFRRHRNEDAKTRLLSELDRIKTLPHGSLQFKEIMLTILEMSSLLKSEVFDERMTEFLMGFEWFNKYFSSDKTQLKRYFKHIQVVRYEPGARIVIKGGLSSDFFIIVTGQVIVLREGEEGVEQINQMGEGSWFGELGIIYKKRRMATVAAKTRCTLFRISGSIYLEICAESAMKMHQKKYRFLCRTLSEKLMTLQYDELQELLYEFQIKTFCYGSPIFDSCNGAQLLILQEGYAASYQNRDKNTNAQRTGLLGPGTFIGVDVLESQLRDTPLPQKYTVCVETQIIKAYCVKKQVLAKFLKTHPELAMDIIRGETVEKQKAMRLERKKNKDLIESSLGKLDVRKENCSWANGYERMRGFIGRKREQLENWEARQMQ